MYISALVYYSYTKVSLSYILSIINVALSKCAVQRSRGTTSVASTVAAAAQTPSEWRWRLSTVSSFGRKMLRFDFISKREIIKKYAA